MDNAVVRKCGSGWAYCDGKCESCKEPNMISTTHTIIPDDCCMINNINDCVFCFEKNTGNQNIYRTDADRIKEAIERMTEYIKR